MPKPKYCERVLLQQQATNGLNHEVTDPGNAIRQVLKSLINDNMEAARCEFKKLSDTHDQAKSLIDKMAENYRSLQVKNCLNIKTSFYIWRCLVLNLCK